MVCHSLLVLPIHVRSDHECYADRERLVRPKHVPPWPPWMFNEIIGFLDVGLDGVDRMTGDIYLKRMHWTREALRPCGQGRGSGSRAPHDMLCCCETHTHEIDPRDNDACTTACCEAIEEAEKFIRETGMGTRGARVWLPAYPLACIDFASAIGAMKAQDRRKGEL